MNITQPEVGDKALFDGIHIAHVVAIDGHSVAFERRNGKSYFNPKTRVTSYPIQIVNIWTWQERSCATTTQQQQQQQQQLGPSATGLKQSRKITRRLAVGPA